MYRVLLAAEFEEVYNKLDRSLRLRIDKQIDDVAFAPYNGKPLGYVWFRERKVRNYRIYYLLFAEKNIAYIVALSDKKAQRETIQEIKCRFKEIGDFVLSTL